jgi:hypothetical protein
MKVTTQNPAKSRNVPSVLMVFTSVRNVWATTQAANQNHALASTRRSPSQEEAIPDNGATSPTPVSAPRNEASP